jgi:hypothetical protein
MRHATLFLILLLVGCTDDLPMSVDDQSVDTDDDADAAPTHNPDLCPGGGTQPDIPGKRKPIPKPKDCTKEPDRESCYQCCDWNSKNVWEERRKRIKDDDKRRMCWEELESRLRPECQAACPRTAFTGELP